MASSEWEYIQDGARIVRRGGERNAVIEALRPQDAVVRLNRLEEALKFYADEGRYVRTRIDGVEYNHFAGPRLESAKPLSDYHWWDTGERARAALSSPDTTQRRGEG